MTMAEQPCVGNCNRRYRKAWKDHEEAVRVWRASCMLASKEAADILAPLPLDQELPSEAWDALAALKLPEPPYEPEVVWVPGDPVWCSHCRARIRAALVEIGDLAAKLEAWSDGHRGAASGERMPSRRTASAPSPSPIADTLDSLYSLIAGIERDWRQHAGHPARPSRARGGDARQRTLDYLLEQLEYILANPGSPAFGHGILAWQTLLQRMTKTDPVIRKRPGRCPACQWVNVLQTRDDAYIECRNCGRLLNEDEYQDDVVGTAGSAVVEETRDARAAS